MYCTKGTLLLALYNVLHQGRPVISVVQCTAPRTPCLIIIISPSCGFWDAGLCHLVLHSNNRLTNGLPHNGPRDDLLLKAVCTAALVTTCSWRRCAQRPLWRPTPHGGVQSGPRDDLLLTAGCRAGPSDDLLLTVGCTAGASVPILSWRWGAQPRPSVVTEGLGTAGSSWRPHPDGGVHTQRHTNSTESMWQQIGKVEQPEGGSYTIFCNKVILSYIKNIKLWKQYPIYWNRNLILILNVTRINVVMDTSRSLDPPLDVSMCIT